MRKSILLLIIFFSASVFAEQVPINELPMYGGFDFSKHPDADAANQKFIDQEAQKYKSKSAAALQFCSNAFDVLFRLRDEKTSMKRFNQAWLLDPKVHQIYLGFAILLSFKDNREEAVRMLQLGQKFGDNQPMKSLIDLARNYGSENVNGEQRSINLRHMNQLLTLAEDYNPKEFEKISKQVLEKKGDAKK